MWGFRSDVGRRGAKGFSEVFQEVSKVLQGGSHEVSGAFLVVPGRFHKVPMAFQWSQGCFRRFLEASGGFQMVSRGVLLDRGFDYLKLFFVA